MNQDTKRCTACEQDRDPGEFGRNRSRRDGLAFYCMPCSREKAKRYMAAPALRERRRQYLADLYQDQPRYLNYRYSARFGITLEQYEALLVSQDGSCALCPYSPAAGEPRLAVDHDHGCCPGKKSCGSCVRGLLCGDCNRALGLFRDDPERLRRAIGYLSR